jgi:hypothetical protein
MSRAFVVTPHVMRLPSVPCRITPHLHPWRRQPFFVEMHVKQGSVGSSGLLRTGCEGIRNRLESSAPGAVWFRTVEGTAATRAENPRQSRIPLQRVRRCPDGPRYLCTTCGGLPNGLGWLCNRCGGIFDLENASAPRAHPSQTVREGSESLATAFR